MNEQKLMKFCMLIPKRFRHCFGYFLVAMTTSGADNYSCFWGPSFFPLQNMYTKKTCIKERKNSIETQTEILETVIRLQYTFYIELLLLPRPWKHHIEFLQMSLFLLVNTDFNTARRLSPAISSSKKIKFSPNKSAKTTLCYQRKFVIVAFLGCSGKVGTETNSMSTSYLEAHRLLIPMGHNKFFGRSEMG